MGQYLPMIVFTAMVVGAIGLVVLLASAARRRAGKCAAPDRLPPVAYSVDEIGRDAADH
jgi:hypothetical protein